MPVTVVGRVGNLPSSPNGALMLFTVLFTSTSRITPSMPIHGTAIAWAFRIPSWRTTALELLSEGRFGRTVHLFLGAMRGVAFRSRPLLAALFRPTLYVQAPCASGTHLE